MTTAADQGRRNGHRWLENESFNLGNGDAKASIDANLSSATTSRGLVNRKPVGRASTFPSVHIAEASTGAYHNEATNGGQDPPRTPTDMLFNQATRSLSSLAGESSPASPVGRHDVLESPPPYENAVGAPPVQDVKHLPRESQNAVYQHSPEIICFVRDNQLDMLRGVLKSGGTLDEADRETGRTALMEAANLRRSGACDILIQSGCRLHLKDLGGNTALHFGAAQGDAAICTMLLEAGAQLDEYNKFGETPLQLAARGG